ncbi:MAG TPA: SPOR domain-containing protein [Caulobacteraceae bacterium]|jgi:hypothetical protein
MSDLEDRGAYTPFSRDQLAFDPRDMRRRRPVPLTLMASAVVLVAMAGAALMFYQSGVRGRNEPPRAIGTKVASIKTPVAPDAKPAADAGQLDVYVQDRPEPGAAQPVYTPPPEQPSPRDALAAKPAVQAAPAAVPQVAPRVATAPKTATAYPSLEAAADAAETAPLPPPVVKKATAPKLAAATRARPAPAKAAAAPIKTAAASGKTAAVGGAQAVQIGAYSSKALADQEFAKVRASFGKFTSGRGVHVEPVQKGSATLYRAAFTGFSKTQATAFCGALKAAGRACIVK